MSFGLQNFNLYRLQYFFFFIHCHALVSYLGNQYKIKTMKNVCMFSSMSFIGPALIIWTLIYFILCKQYKVRVQIYLWNVYVYLFKYYLLKMIFLPYWIDLVLLLKINRPQMYGLFLESQFYSTNLPVHTYDGNTVFWSW